MAARIQERHPDRVPVICDRGEAFDAALVKPTRGEAKIKFLVPRDMTLPAFQRVIRRQLYLEPTAALFLFCGGRLAENTTMERLAQRHRDPDGFLYLRYCGENTFGGPSSSSFCQ